MKKIIIIVIIIVVIFLIWIFYLLFNNGKKINVKATSSPKKFLFIGDSFTDNPNSYADQLKKDYPGINITKIAKVGEKTDWMLQNSSNSIRQGKYDAIFVLGGINDIYARNSISDAKANLQAIYDLAKNNGSKIIGITIAPTDYYQFYDSQKGQLTNELNSWILKNKSLTYAIDFNSLLKSSDGKQDTSLFQADKLHANSQGHRLLADSIEKKVFK